MKKPVNINFETWNWLTQQLSEKDLPRVAKEPGSTLIKLGFIKHPDLVAGTVIELPNEVEYVITRRGAQQLADSSDIVELKTVYDPRLENHRRKTVLNALNGPTFDQIDLI